MAITQDNRLLSIDTDAGVNVLLLDQVAGIEHVSRPFQFDVTMMSEIAENNPQKVDGRKLLGTNASIAIGLKDGTKRYVHGMIRRFSEAGRDRQFVHYRAEIVPALCLLQLTSKSRIFQNVSAKEVIETVLGEYSAVNFDTGGVSGTYTKRDYCTQYRE